MSYTTINQSVNDPALQSRVQSAAMKEAYAGGPEFSESEFAKTLKVNPGLSFNFFMWPTAIANEAAYAYAVDGGNPNPGGDPGVITDADIQAVIQTHWVLDPPPPEQPPELTPYGGHSPVNEEVTNGH
jgi:hypothetical protein